MKNTLKLLFCSGLYCVIGINSSMAETSAEPGVSLKEMKELGLDKIFADMRGKKESKFISEVGCQGIDAMAFLSGKKIPDDIKEFCAPFKGTYVKNPKSDPFPTVKPNQLPWG